MTHPDRFSATSGLSEGTLVLTGLGLAFVPDHATDGEQLGISWDDWQVRWDEIAGLERMPESDRDVRVHHAQAAHTRIVGIDGPLDAFFASVDAHMELVAQLAA